MKLKTTLILEEGDDADDVCMFGDVELSAENPSHVEDVTDEADAETRTKHLTNRNSGDIL